MTRFVIQDSIEGRIAAVLERKRQLFSDLLEQNGPPAQLGLSQDEIFGLFDIPATLGGEGGVAAIPQAGRWTASSPAVACRELHIRH